MKGSNEVNLPQEINLPQIINMNYPEITEFDFRKARGKIWIKYKENPFRSRAMYPELCDGKLVLIDLDDRTLDKGNNLFLLYLPDHENPPFVIRQVREYAPCVIQVLDHNRYLSCLFDLSKQSNPIMGKVPYSITIQKSLTVLFTGVPELSWTLTDHSKEMGSKGNMMMGRWTQGEKPKVDNIF